MALFAKHHLGLLCGAIFLIGLEAPVARAGFAVSPLKQEVTIKPGESGKFTLNLSNRSRTGGDDAQAMHLTVSDVEVAENGSLIFKDPGASQHSASKWIALQQTDVDLDANSAKASDFTVNVPVSAPPGEYYSAIIVTLKNKVRDAKGMLIEYRIASGVFVTVPGRTFPRQAKISQCDLVWPQFQPGVAALLADAQPPKLEMIVKNTGQARFDATGKMALFDEKSRLVFAGPLNTKRPCIFGGDTRSFETPISKTLPPGKYTARITVDYQSTWASLRQTLPVEITPEQAAYLTALKASQPNAAIGIEASPEKLAASIPPGGSRSLAIAVKNIADTSVHCDVSVYATENDSADAWIALSTTDCTVVKGARKTVAFTIRIPAGTKPGKYSSTIALEGGPEGADPSTLLVPVEVDVQSEK